MVDRTVRDENDAGILRREIDAGDGTWAERMAIIPSDGSADFLTGHEFRCFLEFSTQASNPIPAGQRIMLRATLAVNTVLTLASAMIESGQVRIRSFAGGTPTGVFSNLMTSIRANGMTTTPAYAAANSFAATPPGLPAAVDIAGGVLADVVRLRASSQNNSAQTVGGVTEAARGLPPGTVYILVENVHATDAVEGLLKFRWAERP